MHIAGRLCCRYPLYVICFVFVIRFRTLVRWLVSMTNAWNVLKIEDAHSSSNHGSQVQRTEWTWYARGLLQPHSDTVESTSITDSVSLQSTCHRPPGLALVIYSPICTLVWNGCYVFYGTRDILTGLLRWTWALYFQARSCLPCWKISASPTNVVSGYCVYRDQQLL